MTINTIQKIIKIGSSAGVTLPAKDLKHAGFNVGTDVRVTVESVESPEAHTAEVVKITQKLIARHKKALKNLSQR